MPSFSCVLVVFGAVCRSILARRRCAGRSTCGNERNGGHEMTGLPNTEFQLTHLMHTFCRRKPPTACTQQPEWWMLSCTTRGAASVSNVSSKSGQPGRRCWRSLCTYRQSRERLRHGDSLPRRPGSWPTLPDWFASARCKPDQDIRGRV